MSIRLPVDLLAEVDRQAREGGLSRSETVARLLASAVGRALVELPLRETDGPDTMDPGKASG